LHLRDPALLAVMSLRFGSAGAAIRAAGIDYDTVRVRTRPRWDAAKVIRELKRLQRDGKGLWYSAVHREARYLPKMAIRFYGSYAKALRAAGIPIAQKQAPPRPRRQPMPRAEILERLRSLHEKGADLRARTLSRAERHLYMSIKPNFKSLLEALSAAGIVWKRKSREKSVRMRHWTGPIVVETLQRLHREGVDLRIAKIRKSHNPLFMATIHCFGAYGNAIVEAGINYDQLVRAQLAREASLRAAKPE